MYSRSSLISLATLVLASLVAAVPASTVVPPASIVSTTTTPPKTKTTSPPPPGYTYDTAHPVCGPAGFTEVPGSFTETVYSTANLTTTECLNACRSEFPTCKSISVAPKYGECIFYDRKVKNLQFFIDDTSYFSHYDIICPDPVA